MLFTQFAGSTAWLTLPKRVLAAHVAAHGGLPMRGLLARMERRDDRLERLINHVPAFTRRLVADGWLFVLRAGDAILLPSPGPDDVVWHSVFTVGRGANWALSVGFVPAHGGARTASAAIPRARRRSSPRSTAD